MKQESAPVLKLQNDLPMTSERGEACQGFFRRKKSIMLRMQLITPSIKKKSQFPTVPVMCDIHRNNYSIRNNGIIGKVKHCERLFCNL